MKTQNKFILFIFALVVLFLGSCKKSETTDGIPSADRVINHAPIGYKFPAKFEGWDFFSHIDVYEYGKQKPTPTNAKEIYFPDLIDLWGNNLSQNNINKDKKIVEYIFNTEQMTLFGFKTNYIFQKGIFYTEIFYGPNNDPRSYFYPFSRGDYYHLNYYTYYINMNEHRFKFYEPNNMTYNQIFQYLQDRLDRGFFAENSHKIAIGRSMCNLNLVTNL
ncbi:MAG: hypothetical protein CFE21_06420 [Bacteroidetes bacterium B1(2017)]|nr:MAG: hypothetical protein CFE21_06420 [Bacteroidetes bacterium B1(2017)]